MCWEGGTSFRRDEHGELELYFFVERSFNTPFLIFSDLRLELFVFYKGGNSFMRGKREEIKLYFFVGRDFINPFPIFLTL